MDHVSELRKRKGSPIPSHRPSKRRPDMPPLPINGHETPNSEPVYAVESDEDADGATLPLVTVADSVEWQATIERVVRNVVSIHFCQTCSFDTDPACSSEATGFVVDAEKGYIMTNRHVVGYDKAC
jgi:pro-apoptotic serine protease NMA111